MKSQKFLIVITGPTAIGKTAMAIGLAKTFGTEIISADSRQFFREITIGTAKPTKAELDSVKHHFINNLSITNDYDAGQYEQEANAVIEHLFTKQDVLILTGGSGMYIDAVCKGFDNIPQADENTRVQLNDLFKSKGIDELQKLLAQYDPEHYSSIDRNNPHRLIRALEVCITTGLPYSSFRKGIKKTKNYTIIKIGLTTNRTQLYERINHRTDEMIKSGLVDEVKNLLGFKHLNALQTVGYREIFEYLENKINLAEAIDLIKQNTRNFAKRQLTWFKKDKDLQW
ncbi:MAG: tRNA (adenosine(37)-N6)-dimethylallyltransferase MiaA, partial [Bacteroidia bacterium]|nr:tRNA (adenosine(37)-N6)-dimethylallyltransferase MiaA [Bacteroidia bacterium]